MDMIYPQQGQTVKAINSGPSGYLVLELLVLGMLCGSGLYTVRANSKGSRFSGVRVWDMGSICPWPPLWIWFIHSKGKQRRQSVHRDQGSWNQSPSTCSVELVYPQQEQALKASSAVWSGSLILEAFVSDNLAFGLISGYSHGLHPVRIWATYSHKSPGPSMSWIHTIPRWPWAQRILWRRATEAIQFGWWLSNNKSIKDHTEELNTQQQHQDTARSTKQGIAKEGEKEIRNTVTIKKLKNRSTTQEVKENTG